MKKDNVIDMTERVQTPDFTERLKNLKVRLDLEQAKIAISTSLLSIVLLVTVANNNMMTTVKVEETAALSSGGRGIASVNAGNVSEFASVSEVTDESLVHELAKRDLGPSATVGRRPSSVDMLAYGLLEGRYAVRLTDGKLSEIELNAANNSESASAPKSIDDVLQFLDQHRELLPQGFDKHVRIKVDHEGVESTDTYQLINDVSMPVAKVQFRTNEEGRVLAMRVSPLTVASK